MESDILEIRNFGPVKTIVGEQNYGKASIIYSKIMENQVETVPIIYFKNMGKRGKTDHACAH